MNGEKIKKAYMYLGSSPSWIDGIVNIRIFRDFSCNL